MLKKIFVYLTITEREIAPESLDKKCSFTIIQVLIPQYNILRMRPKKRNKNIHPHRTAQWQALQNKPISSPPPPFAPKLFPWWRMFIIKKLAQNFILRWNCRIKPWNTTEKKRVMLTSSHWTDCWAKDIVSWLFLSVHVCMYTHTGDFLRYNL